MKLTKLTVEFTINDSNSAVEIEACVEALDRTGVEMEALSAVSVASLTLYDMLKAIDQNMIIGEIKVLHKSGGKRDYSYIENNADQEIETRQTPNSKSTLIDRKIEPLPSARAGLGRSIKVVGKGSSKQSDTENNSVNVDHSNKSQTRSALIKPPSDDLDLLTKIYEKPLVKLLTPIEPISALNQNVKGHSRQDSSRKIQVLSQK